jgi:putative ABC transport system permease protein
MIERLAEFLLNRALPRGETGESIRADLHQEWLELRANHPKRRFRYWLLWEAVKLAFHFGILRLETQASPDPSKGSSASMGGRMMGSLAQDLRFAVRSLRRRPAFAAVSVLTLGLGIGSAAAMFSVVDGVVLRSVPFRDPGRLVDVWLTADWARGGPGLVGRTWDRFPLSFAEFRAWQAQNTVFEGVAVHNAIETTLTGAGPAERISIGHGSASLLSVLGTQPVLGRWFLPSEEGDRPGGAAPVTVVSYNTWQTRLASDPNVLGREIVLDGTSRTIVGVLPRAFRLRHLGMGWLGEDRRGEPDVWVPLGTVGLGDNGNNLEAIARLSPHVPLEDALVETTAILRSVREGSVVRIVPRSEDETSGLASPLFLLLTATGVLLLIGCANIATLALAELHTRKPELATRGALGAGRGRIVGQLMVESLALGAMGTAVGILLAIAGTRALVRLAPPLPRVEAVGINPAALGFSIALGVLAALLSGTLPALLSARASAAGMAVTTRTATGRRGGFERWLVAGEMALTVVLLVAGGLLSRSLDRLLTVDPGFPAEGLATVSVYCPEDRLEDRYRPGADVVTAYDEILARIRAIPGVMKASAITRLPFPGLSSTNNLILPATGDEAERHIAGQQLFAMPDYFETMGIPLRAGRFLPPDARPGEPIAVVVTKNIARRYWPAGSPIGRSFTMWGATATIVGVTGDVRRNALGVEPDPAFYVSLRQRPAREVSFVARTAGDAGALAAKMAATVRAYDPGIPVRQVTTVPDLIRESTAQERYRTLLMEVFGILATVLAAVGVSGITARGVSRRTREMGVRFSLGAEGRGLVAMVVGDALLPALCGAAVGLVLAAAAGRLIAGFLFGVSAFDAPTYGAAAGFLIVVSLAASWLPARRVASLDPAEVLRAQ